MLRRCLQVPLRFVSGSSNACANAAEVTKRLACLTRLLTRLLQEVWFPAHACQCLVASLFASLFAGKREVAHAGGKNQGRGGLARRVGTCGAQLPHRGGLRHCGLAAEAGLKFCHICFSGAGGLRRPRLESFRILKMPSRGNLKVNKVLVFTCIQR